MAKDFKIKIPECEYCNYSSFGWKSKSRHMKLEFEERYYPLRKTNEVGLFRVYHFEHDEVPCNNCDKYFAYKSEFGEWKLISKRPMNWLEKLLFFLLGD